MVDLLDESGADTAAAVHPGQWPQQPDAIVANGV
jgi:hypothetical protein